MIPSLTHCLQALHKVKCIPDTAVGILRASWKGETVLVVCFPSDVCSNTMMCIVQYFDASCATTVFTYKHI